MTGPFDVIASGKTDSPRAPNEKVEKYVDEGATWWMESITPWRFGYQGEGEWPLEHMRERVLQGPPRVD